MNHPTQEAGLKLVPTEPTPEMIAVGEQASQMLEWQVKAAWSAMVLAAPSPEPMHADLRETIARIMRENLDHLIDPAVIVGATGRVSGLVLAAMQAKSEPAQHWSAARNAFVRAAEKFVHAGQYEEASAIADKFARDMDDLYAHPSPSAPNPDLAGLVEVLNKASDALSVLQKRASCFAVSGVGFDDPCFTDNVAAMEQADEAEDAVNALLASLK